ncbi:MAG TPA: DNA-processing protein DprA [Methylomirabilota bacterium]|nr:DNA-processing protein DprA [Methylomirabilota bacterium]
MSVTRERIQGETAAAAMCINRDDTSYPANLREIPLPPERLWVRGRVEADDTLAMAIVGAREATPYGVGCAERLAEDLAARGITIISGLARGIDSAAHRGALRAGGRTIAVLGSGVDVIYPPENRRLALQVAEGGAVVSQFPLGTPPLAGYFPARNRVIAGLSLGVVVVEAAEKSGSLITAGLAGELGREVMAVPGPLTSLMSRGAHRLIQDGAALVQGWEDVVAQLPLRFRDQVKPLAVPANAGGPDRLVHGQHAEGHGEDKDAGDEESLLLLRVIGREPVGIDHIIERSGLAPGRASALLMALEIEGRIRQLDGKLFVAA